ncbi:MAG TPA: hypothetical protein VMY17_02005 [Thermoplasmata archaeon]|jgi:hypothetical protein|nr:hypothetical protein [Thermoplasmata archaeon]
MKVTAQMASKWPKAIFLILLGVVILYYSGGFVDDLETNLADEFDVAFNWTWDLLMVLMWVLVAWLFVDGVLIIVLSIKLQVYSLNDVMTRLRSIEKKLDGPKPKREPTPSPSYVLPAVTVTSAEDEEPPPPAE